SDYVISK
ncbi:hypothetical protein D046_1776B, partial [Vibrio parahaemolyticus V-223/04]